MSTTHQPSAPEALPTDEASAPAGTDTVPPEPATPADRTTRALADKTTRALVDGVHPSSMVTDTGRFFTWVLSKLLGGVVFSQRSIHALKDAEARGPVVYVMQTRSLIDYLYFNIAFKQHGIGLVRFANGVNTWAVRPFWRALRTLVRGRRGLPKDEECIERLVKAKQPTLIFMQRRSRGPADRATFSRKCMRSVVAAQQASGLTVTAVPLLLVWDKHPDHDRPTFVDEVFGTRQDPGFFRKLLHVAKQTWESFLNLGAPQVEVGEIIDVGAAVAESGPNAALAIETQIFDRLEQERRIIVGPGVKSARQIRGEILSDPRTLAAIRNVSDESGRDFEDVQRDAAKHLKSIAASFSMFVIKLMSALLSAIFNQIYDGLEVDDPGIDALRRVARNKRLVLVPSHKSHIDYLVLSYVFYQRGLIPPHIAAGENLSFWPVGSVFRRAGAFFLRRSFAGDALYPRVFDAYLVKLLEEGFFLEFFIEGTRSRTGKLNPPKYGMLSMLLDAHRLGGVDDLAFMPVSVGYENVIEGSSYKAELDGGEKRSESLGGLLKTSQVLRSRYGRVYVEFGEPIDAAEFLAESHTAADAAPEDSDRTVRRLAYRIIHSINDVTTVTPSALAALIVLNNPARGLDSDTIAREVGFVLSFLKRQGARLSRSLSTAMDARLASIRGLSTQPINITALDEYDREYMEQSGESAPVDMPSADSIIRLTDRAVGAAVIAPLEEALHLLADKGLINVQEVDGETLFSAPEERRTELAFYKNNIIHYFVDEAVFATALYMVEGTHVDVADVRFYAHFLSRLMKHEFCFDERSQFSTVFDGASQYFVERGWATVADDGDTLVVTEPPPAGAEFLRGLLLPTVESYFLVADCLPEMADQWTDEKAFVKRVLSRGRAMHAKGELHHGEATAKSTLANAIRLLTDWNVLERRTRDRGRGRRSVREVRLSDAYRGSLIDELRATLSVMKNRQSRKPGELLRRV